MEKDQARDVGSLVLEDLFDQFKSPEMTAEETGQVKNLLRRISQYEAGDRPRAVDLLRDPWFADSARGGADISIPEGPGNGDDGNQSLRSCTELQSKKQVKKKEKDRKKRASRRR